MIQKTDPESVNNPAFYSLVINQEHVQLNSFLKSPSAPAGGLFFGAYHHQTSNKEIPKSVLGFLR